MSHAFPTLRTFATACLILAGGASLAASPPTPANDDPISLLQDAYTRSVTPGEQADLHRELLATVLQRVQRSHAANVDLAALAAAATKAIEALPPGAGNPAEVFKKAINEALRTLDPYTRYVDGRAHGNGRGDASGSFGGLGLQVEPGVGAVRVVAPMPGSPAARAGLAPGDLIVRVDDLPLEGVPLEEAVSRMRGQPGTPVSITIQRMGTPEFTVSLTRDTIRRELMRWSMEGDVLVLRLTLFSSSAAASMARAIADATAVTQPAAVVLDLRGNPGGLLQEAVKVADAFLNEGEIVSVRGSTPGRQRAWQADTDELLAGLPMVVLIDGRSASASELVADALQHSGRAVVMGQRSLGKGSVQSVIPLGGDKGALRLTTATYFGPSGQTVHRVGVVPDIELLAPGTASSRIAKARVDPRRCRTIGQATDPPLSCAVAYLRAGSTEAFVAALSD